MDSAVRLRGIGGTDIAAILGVDSYRDAYSVWAEKTGRLERAPASPRMRLGKIFERGIVQYYEELTGRATEFLDVTMRHPDRDWMVYTPDAICVHEPRGIDAKFISWDQRHQWGETAYDIPERVQMQCYWYMAAFGYPVWDVAALFGNDELQIYTVERDLEIEREMLAAAEDFWQRHILGGEEPVPGGSPETSRYIKERFPRHRLELRDATAPEAELLDQYAAVRVEENIIWEKRAGLENRIKLAVGDGEGLAWPRGRFTWKNVKDSTKTDWEKLAGRLLLGYADDEQAALKQEFSETKPGVRRIHFIHREANGNG